MSKLMRPIRRLARSARHAYRIWRSSERRFLRHPPGHYYSPLPSDGEIQQALTNAAADQVPGVVIDHEAQLKLLEDLAAYLPDWQFPEKSSPEHRYYSNNGYCLKPDGLVLYSMLRHCRPENVVEVGSGFSSALMLDTNERWLGGTAQITFIDPE